MSDDGVTTKDWSAVQSGDTITVTGTVVAPTGGWSAGLSRAEPQGINPAELLLDLDLEKPDGVVTQALTPIGVEYVERGSFDSVSVKGFTGSIPVSAA